MIKMDHSELIRNTNFEEQRELVQTITTLTAEIAHLQVLLQEQQSNFEVREEHLKSEKTSLEVRITQLESSLANEKTQNEAEKE